MKSFVARSGDIKVIVTQEGSHVGMCFCVNDCESSMCHLTDEEHAEALYVMAKSLYRMFGFEITEAEGA